MNEPWYKEGLRFSCTGCGKCCTGEPGFVWITEEEVQKMADFLGISTQTFRIRYTRQAYGRLALIEDKKSYDCIFLKGKACSVYADRPKQCRKFPWWPGTLQSKEAWEETAKRCEGINHPEAPLIPLEQIEQELGS